MERVAEAYLFADGHALCIDELGRQIPGLSGPRTPLREGLIRAAATSSTRWYGWGRPLGWQPRPSLGLLVSATD